MVFGRKGGITLAIECLKFEQVAFLFGERTRTEVRNRLLKGQEYSVIKQEVLHEN